MSIDALVTGKLWKAPEERRSNAGKTFVVANVRAADGSGESLLVNVVAFSDSAKAALLALEDGDSVALAGTLKIGTYEARDGSVKPSINLTVSVVLTAYNVARKRQATRQGNETLPASQGAKGRPPLSRQPYEQGKPRKPTNGDTAGMNGAEQAAMLYGGGLPDDDL